jgi:hypothetical protein
MVKKDYIKKSENGEVVTRFWYTLKNLDPYEYLPTPFSREGLGMTWTLGGKIVKEVPTSTSLIKVDGQFMPYGYNK